MKYNKLQIAAIEAKYKLVTETMPLFKNNTTKVAKHLGSNRKTIYNTIKEYQKLKFKK